MLTNCSCPAATAIGDIDKVTCPEGFGQIQKIAFTRLRGASGRNSFTSTADITKLASWTPKLTAEDSTKIVMSPYVNAPTSEPGDFLTYGGGNDTLNGVTIIRGLQPTDFTAVLREVPQDIIEQMKALTCEANAGNLGVFLFDGNGRIEAIQDETTVTTYYPIPISTLGVSDKGHGGYENPDYNNLKITFPPNFSDHLKIITPEFNPLTDL